MAQEKQLPGTFPVDNEKTNKRLVLFKKRSLSNHENNSVLPAKSRQTSMQRFKNLFEKKRKVSGDVVAAEMATWQRWWKPLSSVKKEQQRQQQLILCKEKQNNKIGSILSVSVPISISNTTHNYYYGSSDDKTTTTKPSSISTSIVQQLVFLPPLQVYGFMFIITLLLLVIAFAILQLHRTISILQALLNGVSYTVIGVTSSLTSTVAFLKSLIIKP